MTYWVPAYVDLGRHPKTRRLARSLGCPLPNTVGHLLYLWWWAMEYAQDGDVSAFRDQDIADAAEWDGDAATFTAALTEAGFVDGGTRLHDWGDYGGKVLAQRAAHAQRMQRMRDARDGHPAQRDAHVTRTNKARAEHVRSLEVEIEKELDSEPTVQRRPVAAAPVAADAAVVGPQQPPKILAVPKPNKLAEVIDAIKAEDVGVNPSKADADAVKQCPAGAAKLASAYVAAYRGEWPPDSTWLRDNLSLAAVCKRIDGFEAFLASGKTNGASHGEDRQGAGQGRTGGAARARPANLARPANPQHAAHAASIDW